MILNSLNFSTNLQYEKLQNLEICLKTILKKENIFRAKITNFVKKNHINKFLKYIYLDDKKIRKISIHCLLMIFSFESLVNKILVHKKLSFIKSLIILNNDFLDKKILENFYYHFLKKKKDINSFLKKQTNNNQIIWYFYQNEIKIKKIDSNYINIFHDEILDPKIHPFGIFVINKKIKKKIIDFHSKKENVYNRNTVNNFYFFKNKENKKKKPQRINNITNFLELKKKEKNKLFLKNPTFLKKNLKKINQIFFTKFTNNFFKNKKIISQKKKNKKNSLLSKRNSLNAKKCKRAKSSPHKTIQNFLNKSINFKKDKILLNKIQKNFKFKNSAKRKRNKSFNISILEKDKNIYLKDIKKKIYDFKKFKVY